MTRDDGPAFSELVLTLFSAFGKRAECDRTTLKAHWLALRDLPLATVEAAVEDRLRNARYVPNPGELRRAAGASAELVAGDAWARFVAQIREVGSYGTPKLDEAAKRALAELGGWRYVCSLESEEIHGHVRRAFLAAYTAHHERIERETKAALADVERRSELLPRDGSAQ